MFSVTSSGSFAKTEAFLRSMQRTDFAHILEKYGREGVQALSAATPIDSGRTAASWGYEIERKGSSFTLTWFNTDIENGFPVAIMLQYGYGTGTGGFVQGRDYINPAIRPIFDRIAEDIWKVVTSA